jgi:hypothetical protein
MPGSEFQRDLDGVYECIEMLRRLVDISPCPKYSESHRQVPRSSRRLSDLRRPKRLAAQFFKDFHDVLETSFHCTCPGGHDTNMRLDNDWFQVLFAVDDSLSRTFSSPGLKSRPTFGTSVTTLVPETPDEDAATPDEAVIDPADTDEYVDQRYAVRSRQLAADAKRMGSDVQTCWSQSRSESAGALEQRTFPMYFSVNHSGTNGIPIPDLCQFVKTLDRTPPNSPDLAPSVGTLGEGDRSYTARIVKGGTSQLTASVIGVDDWLAQGQDQSWPLSPQKRIDVAQNLANAILQFHATSWIDETWTWRNFSIKDNKRPELYVSRKFYSAGLGSGNPKGKPDRIWRFISEPKLVRLSFALIELAMGKRLWQLRECMEGAIEDGTEDEKDYDTAQLIIEKDLIRGQFGDEYHKVVEICLRGTVLSDTGAKLLTSAVDTFQDDLEQYVTGPLREFFERNWSSVLDT